MSYATISQCVHDGEFTNRVTACFSQEGGDANAAPSALYWSVAGAADVEQAYASALAGNNPNPGGDESVITDQMILSHVQAFTPA